MTDLERKELAEAAAHEAVKEAFMILAIDMENHESIKGIQADLLYMRKLRQGSDDLSRALKRSGISIAILAMAYVLWEGIKSYIGV